jgi:hypothetical protein
MPRKKSESKVMQDDEQKRLTDFAFSRKSSIKLTLKKEEP